MMPVLIATLVERMKRPARQQATLATGERELKLHRRMSNGPTTTRNSMGEGYAFFDNEAKENTMCIKEVIEIAILNFNFLRNVSKLETKPIPYFCLFKVLRTLDGNSSSSEISRERATASLSAWTFSSVLYRLPFISASTFYPAKTNSLRGLQWLVRSM